MELVWAGEGRSSKEHEQRCCMGRDGISEKQGHESCKNSSRERVVNCEMVRRPLVRHRKVEAREVIIFDCSFIFSHLFCYTLV